MSYSKLSLTSFSFSIIAFSPDSILRTLLTTEHQCAVIAGEDIYITSEADPEVDKYPESKRYSGGVFKAYIGIPGKRPNKARVPIGRK